MRRKIINVKVADVEKRRYPSKHYVYIIKVKWDDGSDTVVFRRYSKFFDFQIGLLESFPREGGLKDPSERTIPFLPGKILFGRSHVREVAIKRLKPIDEYCSALVQLPTHISNSEQVLDFFESKPEDLNPSKEENKRRKKGDQDINEISGPIVLEQYRAIADYTRTQSKELTITSGQQLEVIEKHENGWWFVSDEEGERGWVPGVYLEKRDGQSENLITKQAELGHGEKYITTSQFTGDKDEISFGAGVLVEVLQKNLEGWWYVSYQGKQGWAPASYLEKPADAVLRQSNKHSLSTQKNLTENRRSFPGDLRNSVLPQTSTESTSSASPSIPSQRKHLQLTKTNSNPSKFTKDTAVKSTVTKPKPRPNQVQPPPKKSTLNRNSITLKPQKPPPLPPAPKPNSDPVYEYFTTAAFSADIPHGISFEQDKKVKVLEKSPGDWWYISMGDEEGWAPASHVKKVFPNQSPKSPPARPKPPSASKKPTQPEKPARAQINRFENRKENSSPKSPGATSPKIQLRKSPTPLKTSPKPFASHVKSPNSSTTSPKPTTDTTTKFDFKSVLNKAVLNQSNGQAGKPTPAAKKIPSRPTPAANKPKLKPAPTSQSNFDQKRSPLPPSGKNLKKPVISNKKPVQTSLENKNGHVDFRSVLKPTSNAGKTTGRNFNSNNKRPAVPGKPVIPSRPSLKNGNAKTLASGREKPVVSSNRTKFENNANGKATKPVLKRFQQKEVFLNQNSNNNNKAEDGNEVAVSIPNIAVDNRLGGGNRQADDVIASDVTTASCVKKRESESLFVAVADFDPENPGEMGFSKGDVATLLEKSDSWWYMEIKGKSGWVPCFYFEKPGKSDRDPSQNVTDIPLIDDEPVYSEIYENAALLNNNGPGSGLHRVLCDFTGSNESAISFGKGDAVHLVEKSDDWCFVRIVGSENEYLNAEGWVPSHYLEQM